MEAAERSIAAMSGSSVEGVQLQVSYARRQPKIEPINDASTSSAWSTIGEPDVVLFLPTVHVLPNLIYTDLSVGGYLYHVTYLFHSVVVFSLSVV